MPVGVEDDQRAEAAVLVRGVVVDLGTESSASTSATRCARRPLGRAADSAGPSSDGLARLVAAQRRRLGQAELLDQEAVPGGSRRMLVAIGHRLVMLPER